MISDPRRGHYSLINESQIECDRLVILNHETSEERMCCYSFKVKQFAMSLSP